jgi:ParB family transcriptional regulator, chromosome partitioning protein
MTLQTQTAETQAAPAQEPPASRPFKRPIKDIPLASLVLTKINVRKHKDKDVESLAATIRIVGLLQPIGVRSMSDGAYEVVFGERRTLAIRKLHNEGHPGTDMVPALILEEGDDAAAIEASMIENIERLPMDEMDQYETFAALQKQDRTIPQIAFTFGCTEQLVKKRLAIGNLLPKIRQMYRNEDIGAKELQLLTMASTAKQKQYVKAFETGKDFPQQWQLKEWLLGGSAIKTSVALFNLVDYKAPVANDLFGEDAYFTNAELFWKLQNAAIAKQKEALEASGWAAVHIVEPNEHFQSWNYADLAKAKGGHVYIVIKSSGEVEIRKGLVTTAELRNLERKADKDPNTGEGESTEDVKAETPVRPELSEPLCNYIDLVRHSAVRAELAKTPNLALRLAVAQLIAGSKHWSISAEGRQPANDAIAKALKDLPTEKAFKDVRAKAKALLPKSSKRDTMYMGDKEAIRSPSHGDRVILILANLQTLPDNDVLAILASLTAETLALGTEIVDTLGATMGVDVSKRWQPDDTFFDLTRDKEVLNAMLSEVIGKDAAASYLTGTGKTKKEIIRKALNGDGRKKVDGWLPRWFNFPATSYTKRKLTKVARSKA